MVGEADLERFYDDAGGDCAAVLARLRTPERVVRFVRLFGQDETYDALERALASDDAEGAFRASHTLKGVARDVGLTALGDAADAVCEALRGADGSGAAGDLAAARALMGPVRERHAQVAAAIEAHLGA